MSRVFSPPTERRNAVCLGSSMSASLTYPQSSACISERAEPPCDIVRYCRVEVFFVFLSSHRRRYFLWRKMNRTCRGEQPPGRPGPPRPDTSEVTRSHHLQPRKFTYTTYTRGCLNPPPAGAICKARSSASGRYAYRAENCHVEYVRDELVAPSHCCPRMPPNRPEVLVGVGLYAPDRSLPPTHDDRR